MKLNQHQELMRSVRESQERSKKTLASIDSTLLGVKQSLKDIDQTNRNIDNIKEQYNAVMTKLAHKVANSISTMSYQPFKKKQGVEYKHVASDKVLVQQIAKQMLQESTILILTGAGISAPSGIPTFRGKSGLYAKKFTSKKTGKEIDAQQFITKTFYQSQPESIWEWVHDIYCRSIAAKPNKIHLQLHQLALHLAKLGKNVVVSTQNIDDLHIKPANKQYEFFDIHGNCKKVRCKNHHFQNYQDFLRKGQTFIQKIRLCKICQQPLRPHILFFDESYGKNHGGQVKNREFPFVIVVGSSVRTGLAIKFIQDAQRVVQINPEPVLQIGNVASFKGDTATVLMEIRKYL